MSTPCPEDRDALQVFLHKHLPIYYCTPVCEPSLTGGTPRSVIKIPYPEKEKSIRIYALYTCNNVICQAEKLFFSVYLLS